MLLDVVLELEPVELELEAEVPDDVELEDIDDVVPVLALLEDPVEPMAPEEALEVPWVPLPVVPVVPAPDDADDADVAPEPEVLPSGETCPLDPVPVPEADEWLASVAGQPRSATAQERPSQ